MLEKAQGIMGRNIIGPKELANLHKPFLFDQVFAPKIPFSEDVLKSHADTHMLILTPQKHSWPITLNLLREKFGTDPATSEPCMYNQDWYLKEDFAAKVSLDGKWHLLPKKVREDARAKQPGEIEKALKHEQLPTAVTCAFTFFAWWMLTGGEKLWKHDFVWCSDRDHNGDRIYVGRYEDSDRVNKNGFNIHRHLALRPAYSAAPEITS